MRMRITVLQEKIRLLRAKSALGGEVARKLRYNM